MLSKKAIKELLTTKKQEHVLTLKRSLEDLKTQIDVALADKYLSCRDSRFRYTLKEAVDRVFTTVSQDQAVEYLLEGLIKK